MQYMLIPFASDLGRERGRGDNHSEREQDTWVSLTASLLSGREIILSKIRGSLWSVRRIVWVMMGLWLTGLISGAVHPLGVLASMGVAVFAWFTAALGVFVSLRAKNSTRAWLQPFSSFWSSTGPISSWSFRPFTDFPSSWRDRLHSSIQRPCSPTHRCVASGTHRRFHSLNSPLSPSEAGDFRVWLALRAYLFYEPLALTWMALRAFDKAVDRPRRTRGLRCPLLARQP